MIEWTSRTMRTAAFGLSLCLLAAIYCGVNLAPTQLAVDMIVDAPDAAQVFYSTDGRWSETQSLTNPLTAGWNRVIFTLPVLQVGPNVRFDPGTRATTYRILGVHWIRGGIDDTLPLDAVLNPRRNATQLTLADGQLLLHSDDNDAQLILPSPGFAWRILSAALPLGIPLAGLLLLFAGVRRNVSIVRIAATFLSVCAAFYFIQYLYVGPRLPLYDDWRYLVPGRFDMIDGEWSWLIAVTNDTYYLTNQLLDFVVLKLSNVDFFWLRAAALSLLMLQLATQYRVLVRVADTQPAIAAVGVALGIWSLASGAYWGGTAVAYQQVLPILFATMVLAHLAGLRDSISRRLSFPLIFMCCLGAGLAYISGGLLIVSLGVACLLADVNALRGRGATVVNRAGWVLLGLGAASLLLQLVLVSKQQGSLLEHNHAVASIYPNDRRFWLFFFSLYGRSLGYTGLSPIVDALLAALMLLPAMLFGTEQLLAFRRDSQQPRSWWILLALYAGIGSATYAAVVAFGRAGFTPEGSSIAQIVAAAKSRFHYWPVAAMIPYAWLGWAEIAQRLRRWATALRSIIATLMLLPKSLLAFASNSYLLYVDNLERAGAHCVVARLADIDAGRPVVCTALTGISLDIGPTLAKLRARNSPVYRTLLDEGGEPQR